MKLGDQLSRLLFGRLYDQTADYGEANAQLQIPLPHGPKGSGPGFGTTLLPIAVLLCFGLLSCRSVQSKDLAGTWTMKESSRQILPAELRENSAKIILRANGTFVASDMPGLFDFPPAHPQLEGGSGIWKLVSREGKQQVQLDFQVVPTGRVTTKLPFSTQMDVSKGWSAVSLYYFLGDPDEELRVEFERKGSSAPN